jgi:DtxR family Mn-dependent transcriptional regulator
LGTELKIIEIEKFDASMKISFQGKIETLSKMVCEKLLVKNK